MTTRQLFTFLVALAAGSHGPTAVGAESIKDYPSRPIRLILPNAPGSANDTINRLLAARLGKELSQQIVVDNRAGAGGIVAMEIAKNANPDGYTLISLSTASTSIAPHVHKKLPYDSLQDFEYVALVAILPDMLVINPAQPPKTVKEFIDYAKSRGRKLNMASAGNGSQSHLSGTALMMAAGFESVHVPYKGGGPSAAAVIAGESQWAFTPAAGVMSLVKSGRLRGLGHSLPQRTPLLGEMPAIAETVTGFYSRTWYGLTVPKGTSRLVIDKLRSTVIRLVGTPEFKEQLALLAAEAATTSTPEEFRKFVQDDIARTGKVVKAAGLKAE